MKANYAAFEVEVDSASGRAYVADGLAGIQVLQLGDGPLDVSVLDVINPGKLVWDIEVEDGQIVIAFDDDYPSSTSGGLQVIQDWPED